MHFGKLLKVERILQISSETVFLQTLCVHIYFIYDDITRPEKRDLPPPYGRI